MVHISWKTFCLTAARLITTTTTKTIIIIIIIITIIVCSETEHRTSELDR